MCGIVGFVGKQSAAPILLKGLQQLEYRGYDSAGIAVMDARAIRVEKVSGRIARLCEKTDNGASVPGSIALFDGKNNLKKLGFDPKNKKYILHSCNPDTEKYPDIIVDELQIQGVVKGSYHKH